MTCSGRWQIVRERCVQGPPRCERCGVEDAAFGDGRRRGSLDIHHRIPLRFGGSDKPENWAVLCKSCHRQEDAAFLARAASFYVSHGGT
jgi:5-methylcytosine-specific restriction endonuclease McrA